MKNTTRKNFRIYTGIVIILFLFGTLSVYLISKSDTKLMISFAQSAPPNSLSVLTANVGNMDWRCKDAIYKLCLKDVEQRISNNIQTLHPDIIALQEVLAPWQYIPDQETNRDKVLSEPQAPPQARRLLGSNYTISCNIRNEYECIGVQTSIGEILGCPPGLYCVNARTGPEIPGCDNGFTVSAVTVKLSNGFTFDVVNAHPQSTDSECRAKMLSVIFKGYNSIPPLIQSENVLIMGDFNLDPWRERDGSVTTWNQFFDAGWAGKQFHYHSGIVEKDPPAITSVFLLRRRTYDFIVSNFARGTCHVLGEMPGTSRLDGGKGTDHRSVYGIINIDK